MSPLEPDTAGGHFARYFRGWSMTWLLSMIAGALKMTGLNSGVGRCALNCSVRSGGQVGTPSP